MAKFKKAQERFLSSQNPKLKVNLKEVFGIGVESSSVRQAMGQAIIDKILDRAESGVDVNGRAFKKYSDSYANSDDFKAFGKDKNKVNLRLTGDMLELMDIIDEDENTITIGWNDDEEASKAHGHITGDGNNPKRDFFGLTAKEIDQLRSQFRKNIGDEETLSSSKILKALRALGDDDGEG